MRVRFRTTDAPGLTINGTKLTPTGTEPNPYRPGGTCYARADVVAALRERDNTIEIAVVPAPRDRVS